MTDFTPKRERELLAVAAAAIEWNRARLRRAAVERHIPNDGWRREEYSDARAARAWALKEEARALAKLRKTCAAADPAALTINVEAAFTEPEPLTLEAPQ